MATTQVYPTTTIPMPSDIQAHTNELFDFDDEYLVQSDIKQEDFVRVYDRTGTGAGGIADKNHFLFQMNDVSNNSFYAPSRSYLKVDFHIRRPTTGTPPVADTNMMTFASDIRSIFRRVRFSLAGQTVTDVPDFFYAWVGQDANFWTPQYLNEQGRMMLCYPKRDSQPGMEMRTCSWCSPLSVTDATPGNNTPVRNNNTYQNSRGLRENLSASLETGSAIPIVGTNISCFIPLPHMSSALQYMDKAITQLQWEIELWCSDDFVRCYNSTPTTLAKFEFVNNGIELWAKRYTPSETGRLVLTEQLNRGFDFTTKFADLQIHRFPIDEGNPNALKFDDIRVTTTANRPIAAIVAYQYGDTWTTQRFETDEFTSAHVKEISMLINNVQVPTEAMTGIQNYDDIPANEYPYKTQITDCDLVRYYHEYLKFCGNYKAPFLTGFGSGAGTLTKIDWLATGAPYCFSLSEREIGAWSGSNSEIRVRAVRENLTTQPLVRTDLHMWVFLWVERELSIHQENWNSYISVA